MKDCLMSLKIRKNKSPIIITLLLILALLTGLTAGYFSTHGITENGKFEAFSGKVFQNEVSGSTLTLHYTLAHPEKQGIRRKKASLGTVPTDMKNTYQICSQYEKKLKSFRYSRLSTENQRHFFTVIQCSYTSVKKNCIHCLFFLFFFFILVEKCHILVYLSDSHVTRLVILQQFKEGTT